MKSIALLFLLLWSPVLVGGPLPANAGDLEPLHLFKIAGGVMTVGVATTGYTDAQSFRVEVGRTDRPRTCSVRLVRVRRDEGKMMPQPLIITFRLADLKIDPNADVRVENPFCSRDD